MRLASCTSAFISHQRPKSAHEQAGEGPKITVAAESMRKTVEAIQSAGLRDRVKIMIGGGMVDEHVRVLAGADAFGSDAMAAVSLAKQWTGS